jgi:hypothetical protein
MADKETSYYLRASMEQHERDISRMVKYIQSLEAFMAATAAALGCLPSYTDPGPNDGNTHIMLKLNALIDALRLVLKRGTLVQRSDQYMNEVLGACRSVISRLDAEQNGGGDD